MLCLVQTRSNVELLTCLILQSYVLTVLTAAEQHRPTLQLSFTLTLPKAGLSASCCVTSDAQTHVSHVSSRDMRLDGLTCNFSIGDSRSATINCRLTFLKNPTLPDLSDLALQLRHSLNRVPAFACSQPHQHRSTPHSMAWTSSSILGRKRKLEDGSARSESPLFMTERSSTPRTVNSQGLVPDSFDDSINEADEEGDDGGAEEEDQPYDESSEAFPRRPAFDEDLAAALVKAHDAVGQLHYRLLPFTSHSEELKAILAKTKEALRQPEAQRLQVGMVGDTGAGKSALLNTVTDTPSLAKELYGGESCTSVPTIYTHRLPWQTREAFAAEILYYTPDKCRKLLEDQIRAYNLFNFEKQETWSANMKTEYEQAAETALQTLRTLFCGKADFESPRAAKERLQANYTIGGTALLEHMVSWCQDYLREHVNKGGASFQRCYGESAEELNREVDPLTSPKHHYDEPSLWPLVEKVTVGVPSVRVLKYIDLMDLPGMTDTNVLRVQTTRESIGKCHALWYVVAVGRVCTDDNLERTISIYAERFPGTLAVVVSKIDQGVGDGIALAADMRSKGQSVGDFNELTREKARLEESIARYKTQLKKKLDPGRRNHVRDEKERLEREVEALEARRFEAVVDARNSYVSTRLKREKQKHIPAGHILPVYCISNTEYMAHKNIGAKQQMSVESTGIPALRAFALALAAPAVWRATEDHLSHKIPVLFRGAQLWAQNTPANHNADLIETVKGVQSIWDIQIGLLVDRCKTIFETTLIAKIQAGLHGSQRHALTVLREIVGWYHQSFLAFFRKAGNHYTRAIGDQSWNERFLEHQSTKVLSPAWKDMLIKVLQAFRNAVTKLATSIEEVPDQLKRQPSAVPLPIEAFKGVLEVQINGINNALETELDAYQLALSNTKLDAELDQHTGFFTQAMQPCYAAGQADAGKGVVQRCKNLLQDHLTEEDPLSEAKDRLSRALKDKAKYHAILLQDKVNEIIEDIVRSFEGILLQQTESSAERKARALLGPFLERTMPDIDNLEPDLARIHRKYGVD